MKIFGQKTISADVKLCLLSALIILCCPVLLHSQVDSLRVELSKAKEDSVKLRLCLAIAAQLTNNNVDSTLVYADKAELIARKMGSAKGVADAQYQRAYAVFYAG